MARQAMDPKKRPTLKVSVSLPDKTLEFSCKEIVIDAKYDLEENLEVGIGEIVGLEAGGVSQVVITMSEQLKGAITYRPKRKRKKR